MGDELERGGGRTSQGSGASTDLLARAEDWCRGDPDPDTQAELRALIAERDLPALADRFDGRLEFGTAGLRGPLGAGPRRMNRLVVRRAAAGLARHVGPGAHVVVGRDARRKSDVFAEDSARVLAAAGCRASVLPRPVPTPLLAFAVRELDADAGVMVTASHNPRGDNGYKVYLGDGAQLGPPAEAAVAAAIDDVGDPHHVRLAPPGDPAIVQLSDDVETSYVRFAASVVDDGPRDVAVVYTPMHGVGGRLALAAFDRAGFPSPAVVAEQAEPDPDFPTVPIPNPEEPGALDLAVATATRVGADVILANDPDADRLGVAVPDGDDGGWRPLTGNEIGLLLADAVLGATSGPDRLVVSTIVSSPLVARLAARRGVHHVETLTGFKWVVRAALRRPDLRFVFGFEEALGYAVADRVRDKDGITAALAFADLVARLRAEGRTVEDRLVDLARELGFPASLQWSLRDDGPGGHERLAAAMARLRTHPPRSLAGQPVTAVEDLLTGAGGDDGDLPASDAVRLWVGDARVIVRPSGTEPKLKCYLDLTVPLLEGPRPYAATRRASGARLEALREALASALAPPG